MMAYGRIPALDIVVRAVLGIYIAVLPFKQLLVVERNGFLVLLVLLALWCNINRRLFYSQTPYDLLLLSFIAWVAVTIPFAVSPSYSLTEYGKVLQHMVVFYAVIYFFKDRVYQKILIGVISFVAFLASAYGLTQLPLSVASFFPAEQWLTTFLVMTAPLAFALACGNGPGQVKVYGTILLPVMSACLFATQSRAGLVALLAEFWVLTAVIRTSLAKFVAGVTTFCVIAAVLVSFNMSARPGEGVGGLSSPPVRTSPMTVIHRFDIWKFTLSEIQQHWLVGIGYGGLSYLHKYGQEQEVILPGHASVKNMGTHNIFLQLALHVGIPGMIIFGWFYVRAVIRTLQESRMATEWFSKTILVGMVGSLIGLIVRLQFDQMLVGSLAVQFWVLLALAVLNYPSLNKPDSAALST